MPVLQKIAYYQGRRDEVPNQMLAQELAEKRDRVGIGEVAENLWNTNKSICSDCLKVLYEIGYIEPGLIADYADVFLKLLKSKENRMVWGAMIALSTIAGIRAREIMNNIDDVIAAVSHGSVITMVSGVRVLARTAAALEVEDQRRKILQVLSYYLKTCIPRDLPTNAESILPAVDKDYKEEFLSILAARQPEMSPAQLRRINKVTRLLMM